MLSSIRISPAAASPTGANLRSLVVPEPDKLAHVSARSHLVVLLLVGISLGLLAAPAQGESYARVCAAVIDAKSNEAPLTESSAPGPGVRAVVHLDANTGCVALIIPLLQQSTRLANGWRPQLVTLAQWEEQTLPVRPAVWNWNAGADAFDLWIFFFKPDAAELGEIRKLVTAMQDPTLSGKVLFQQTRQLREKLGPRMSGKPAISQEPKASSALVGGSLREIEFPWRKYAQKVTLNKALEGEWVLRHGR